MDNINDYLLTNLNNDCFQYEALICNPIKISGAKTVKLLKRGWRNVLRQPLILFDDKFQNIKVHFDMHHRYGNLEKAIKLLDENDRDDFYEYVRLNNKFNPHIMFISKKKFYK